MIHQCDRKERIITECGCALDKCSICGTMTAVSKCSLHQPVQHYSQDYYLHELRGVYNSIPQHRKMCLELEIAMMKMCVEMPRVNGEHALDIGAGIGVYAPFFMKRGYSYEALETDVWASKYILGAYDVPVHKCTFEAFTEKYRFSVVLASHVLEHMKDARAMLDKMVRITQDGGRIIVIVPDQTDLCNPDHSWFFTPESIKRWCAEAGLTDIRQTVEQVVAHEKFIYTTGIKHGI